MFFEVVPTQLRLLQLRTMIVLIGGCPGKNAWRRAAGCCLLKLRCHGDERAAAWGPLLADVCV